MGSAGGRGHIPGSAGRVAPGETKEAQKLARVVFAVLVVACFVAFVLTQRLKHTPTPVQEFKMDERLHPDPGAGGGLPWEGAGTTGELERTGRVSRVQDCAGR